MKTSAHSTHTSEIRVRIAELRRQLWDTTQAYQIAKEKNAAEEISPLLRQKSSLTRELLQAQRELLSAFGQAYEGESAAADPHLIASASS